MKHLFKNVHLLLAAAAFLVPATLLAQQDNKEKTKDKTANDMQQIIITRDSDKKDKVVIEINGDNVTINGKPLSDYKNEDGDLKVRLQKFKGSAGMNWTPRTFNGNDNFKVFSEQSNTAMLGVSTEKKDDGVVVNDVTEESAAAKMGIKEGDIITKIDDTKIEDPDDLSAAVKKHKPGDKVTVNWTRDKKEQKATGELTAWKGPNFMVNGNFNMDMNKNLDLLKSIPRFDYTPRMNWSWSGTGPKLGLSVQDSDDGKGVKVIDVDDESNAAKAGIKEGDVITEVDGKAVNGTDDVVKAIRDNKDKISTTFKVTHDGKSQNIEVKMPRKIKTADL